MKVVPAAAAALLLLSACTSADPFRDGQNAFARGDLKATVDSLQIAADAGDAKAARTLALIYYTGMEVSGGQKVGADAVQAARWYGRAAELGDEDAAHHLAVMYTYGRGVRKDYDEAMRLFGDWGKGTGFERERPEERAEVEVWGRCLRVAMEDQLPQLRKSIEDGAVVTVVFRARNSDFSLKTSGAAARVIAAVDEAARHAIAVAPPTPAAARRNIAADFTVKFRYKD